MAHPFLKDLEALLHRLGVDAGAEIECRHFFSGAAAYVNGTIFMSLSPSGLAVKLPSEDCIRLLQEGGTPLRYFPQSPVKKGYVVLPAETVQNDAALKVCIASSITCATTGG